MVVNTDKIFCITFNSDGKILAIATKDNVIQLWDIENRTQIGSSLAGHSAQITSLAFSPDMKYLSSGSSDNTVRLWEISRQGLSNKFWIKRLNEIRRVSYNPKDKVILTHEANKVYFWDISRQLQVNELVGKELYFQSNRILLSKNKVIVEHERNKCIVGEYEHFWVNLEQWCNYKSDISSDGYLAMGLKNNFRLFDLNNNHLSTTRILPLDYPTLKITELKFSPNGKILALFSEIKKKSHLFGEKYLLHLWNVEMQQFIGSIKLDFIQDLLVFSPDNQLLISNFNTKLCLWETLNLSHITTKYLNCSSKIIIYLVSSDSSLVTNGNENGNIELWDIKNFIKVAALNAHSARIVDLSISSNNELLLSCCADKNVRLWSVANKQCIKSYNFISTVNSLLFTNEDNFIIVAHGREFSIFQRHSKQSHQTANYYLSWYAGTLSLNLNNLNITNVRGLSADNLLLINQLGAIGLKPTVPEEINKLADCLFKNGRAKFSLKSQLGSIKDHDEAIKLIPHNSRYLVSRAEIHNAMGHIHQAIQDFDLAIKQNPDNAAYYFKSALLKAQQKETENAIADLNYAIRFEPKEAKYYHVRGQMKSLLSQHAEAIKDYSEAIKLNSNNLYYYQDRAVSLTALNLADEAKNDITRIGKYLCKPKNYFYDSDDTQLFSTLIPYLNNKNVKIRCFYIEGIARIFLVHNRSTAKILELLWQLWDKKPDIDTMLLLSSVFVCFDIDKFIFRDGVIDFLIDSFNSDVWEHTNFIKNILTMFSSIRNNFFQRCKDNTNSTNTILRQKSIACIIKLDYLFNTGAISQIPKDELSKAKLAIALTLKEQADYYTQLPSSSELRVRICCPFSRGVGNCAIPIRYCAGHFIDKHDPIIEEEFVKNITINNTSYIVHIIAIAGQEEYEGLRISQIKHADAIMMAYDCCDEKNFSRLKEDLSFVKNNNKLGNYLPKIVVLNKIDLKDERKVTSKNALFTTLLYGLPFIECSAKDKVNIDEIFETLLRFVNYDYAIAKLLNEFSVKIQKQSDKKFSYKLSNHHTSSPGLFKSVSATENPDESDKKSKNERQEKEQCCLM